MPLRLRRGTNAERLVITPLEGELIYTTDTKKIFVGDGNTVGGISLSSSTGGFLGDNLSLNGNDITGVGNVSIVGNISNGVLTLSNNVITSLENYISPGSGNPIGILQLSNSENLLQVKRDWTEFVEPVEIQYGLTNGLFSLITSKNSSRGTIDSPTVVQPGDALTIDRTYGYDGFDYVLSSSIWHGVDPTASIIPGVVPGAIAFVTEGIGGQNVAGFDSRGYFGINKFPAPATEALDVDGNGLFSGTVTAAAFKGTFVGDDSTVLVDGINGRLSNGTVFFESDKISSLSGSLTLDNNLQLVRNWTLPDKPIDISYGITGGVTSLLSSRYASRGTIESPTSLNPGDCISSILNYGHDGTDYVISSGIWTGVDLNATVTTGTVPGRLIFFTNAYTVSSEFNHLGYFGVRNGATPPLEPLDVHGNAVVRGDLTANAFKGTFVADNLTVLINGATGELNNGLVSLLNDTISSLSGSLTLDNNLQLVRNWTLPDKPIDISYGITGGINSLLSSRYASRGTIESPTSLNPGDCISSIINYGHDGTDYVISSGIWTGVDLNATVTTGTVPGRLIFFTSAYTSSSEFNHLGYFGVCNGATPPLEPLDVHGNAVVRGDLTASAFKGTFVGDDSTIIIDGITGNITGNIITANEFVSTSVGSPVISSPTSLTLNAATVVEVTGAPFRLPHFTTAERDALIAVNGDMIYNTDLNKFQGYENGAWANLI